jgi:hypothetical protein
MQRRVMHKRSKIHGPVELATDGTIVWVHGPSSVIAEFAPKVTHNVLTSEHDSASDELQKLWEKFIERMAHDDIAVPKSFRPGWCK